MTKREPDQGGFEVWSTVISAKGEGHRYSSSGGSAERQYFKAYTNPPHYYTYHNRATGPVRVRVSNAEIISEVDYNINQVRVYEHRRRSCR